MSVRRNVSVSDMSSSDEEIIQVEESGKKQNFLKLKFRK